jgi:hypothetical protein
MKTYLLVDVYIYFFLTSTLVISEWSASRQGRFIPVERAGLNDEGKRNKPLRESFIIFQQEKFYYSDVHLRLLNDIEISWWIKVIPETFVINFECCSHLQLTYLLSNLL